MTPEEIEVLFKETVEKKSFSRESGLGKQIVYNYRHRTTGLSTKIEVLFNMGLINITKNGSTS